MIIEFTIGNYRSFLDPQTISFRATTMDSTIEDVNSSNMVDENGQRLLKILGIYGPNASGKSNLLRGLKFFRDMIVESLISEELLERSMQPFRVNLLMSKDNEQAGFFQAGLLLNGQKFRYGFTLNAQAEIGSEWLFGPANQKETYYFKRTGNEIDVNTKYFPEGQKLPEDKLRPNALFLSFCSSYDGKISQDIRTYFIERFWFERSSITNLRRSAVRARQATDELLKEPETKAIVLNWLNAAGLPYEDIRYIGGNKDDYSMQRVALLKRMYDTTGKSTGIAVMDLDADESDGTKKFYNYIGELNRLFKSGGIFIVDEIDNNFHPFLLRKLVSLFQSPVINKVGAQLLFSSHDTNLLQPDCMRRDQFYFTEKTFWDTTQLYSLADLKGIRNNADFARQYLAGFYGALPHLSSFLTVNESGEKK